MCIRDRTTFFCCWFLCFFFFFTPEADTSDVPLLTIDRIEGNNGILKIHYTTADAEGKQLSTGDWKYSTDGGATWILIDETAIFNNAPKPAGPHILEWDTRLGLNSPSGAYLPALLFRMQVYDTEITQGVILMCTPDNYFQKFQIKGREFIKYQHKFLERVDKYYNDQNKADT
mgnify:CR=1 FL=1